MLRLTPLEAARFLGKKAKPGTKAAMSSATTHVKREQASALSGKAETMLLGLPEHTPEYKFHPTRKWRFDYAWPELRIALELHGGVHSRGRHTRGTGFVADREKMNNAILLGWRVLEVTPEHIKNGTARQWLEQLIYEDQGND